MRKSIRFSIPLIITAFIFSANAQNEFKPSAEIVVHLLDYLAKDYAGAVQDGKVISKGEYSEQVEFVAMISKNAQGVQKLNESHFLKGVAQLSKLINDKKDSNEVSQLARNLQQDAIRLAHIEVAPTMLPDLVLGEKLYSQNCVSCHGSTARGDGLAGAGLEPKPANFHDPDLVWNSAPYKFYNTIRLGVPGTGMIAFPGLSDHEVWSLSYYIKSLPYSGASKPSSENAIAANELATLTDAEIAAKLGGDSPQVRNVIASLRAYGSTGANQDPLMLAETLLNQSIEAAKSGDYSTAQTLAINAYLQGIEPIEPKLRANLPGFVEQIESQMTDLRSSLLNKESAQSLEAKKLEILVKLKEAKAQISATKMSSAMAFGAAFSIFLREGFEAILIIIVLLSILKAMKQPKAAIWVHVGWIAAAAVGVVAWFLSGALMQMSGLSREIMEGAISLFAVVVLIYVGFWLHRYREVKRWHIFLAEKLRHGLSKGSFLGLAVVSFLAVFREAFEVVLFLRAIWIDLDSSGQSSAGLGVLTSVTLLGVLSYFSVKGSHKLPLSKLFQVCSWTMMVLAVVLTGKGLHSLQEAGIVNVSTLPFPLRIDLLGIYPSYQTAIAQLALVIVFAVLLFIDRKQAQ